MDLPFTTFTLKDVIFELFLPTITAIYFIYRVVRSRRVSKSRALLAEQIAQNPGLGKEVAAELIYFYGKLPFSENINMEETAILKGKKLDKYTILGVQEISAEKYLFITQCNDISYKDNGKKVERPDEIYFYNFLLTKNYEREQYEVYSTNYNCLSDKHLITGFSKAIFKYLTTPENYSLQK